MDYYTNRLDTSVELVNNSPVERLRARKSHLENEIKSIDEALEALEKNPALIKVIAVLRNI